MKANYLTLHSALKMYLVSEFLNLILIKSQKRHPKHWHNMCSFISSLLDLGYQKINSGLELGGVTTDSFVNPMVSLASVPYV